MSQASFPALSGESPVDRAMSLASQGERDQALRWAAAVVIQDPSMPTALCLVGRLLGQMGRSKAARDACKVAIERAIDLENLPLAVAAAEDLKRNGGDLEKALRSIADAFCKNSPRQGPGAPPPPPLLKNATTFAPLPPHLIGTQLVDAAEKAVLAAKNALKEVTTRPGIAALPLFSSIGKEGLFALCSSLTAKWIGSGAAVIEQGAEGNEAYFVARGELEVRRKRGDETTVLAKLSNGALFGEMALLARAPRSGSVVAIRPTIVLEVKREALDRLADEHQEVGTEIAKHCRDRMIENLIRTSHEIMSVPEADRHALIERFQTKTFEQNSILLEQDQNPAGLYIIASGEVAVVRRERSEGERVSDPLILSTLVAGDIVGEVATVLRRKASADVIALHPTVTLFLPASDFMALVHDHPTILKELYILAVQRDEETASILSEEASAAEDFILV